MVKIIVDTSKDSIEDIGKVIGLLRQFVGEDITSEEKNKQDFKTPESIEDGFMNFFNDNSQPKSSYDEKSSKNLNFNKKDDDVEIEIIEY